MKISYTKKEAYLLKLHELLWEFIEYHDLEANRTGDVTTCAEQVLSDMRQPAPKSPLD